jgi:hypothetical protein
LPADRSNVPAPSDMLMRALATSWDVPDLKNGMRGKSRLSLGISVGVGLLRYFLFSFHDIEVLKYPVKRCLSSVYLLLLHSLLLV